MSRFQEYLEAATSSEAKKFLSRNKNQPIIYVAFEDGLYDEDFFEVIIEIVKELKKDGYNIKWTRTEEMHGANFGDLVALKQNKKKISSKDFAKAGARSWPEDIPEEESLEMAMSNIGEYIDIAPEEITVKKLKEITGYE